MPAAFSVGQHVGYLRQGGAADGVVVEGYVVQVVWRKSAANVAMVPVEELVSIIDKV